MQTIKIETFKDLVDNGKIFSVRFVKKNGEMRNMSARLHVSALIKPAATRLAKGVRSEEDARCNVLTVYDMAKIDELGERGAFRRINLATIQHVTINKVRYAVEG